MDSRDGSESNCGLTEPSRSQRAGAATRPRGKGDDITLEEENDRGKRGKDHGQPREYKATCHRGEANREDEQLCHQGSRTRPPVAAKQEMAYREQPG
jgi:hypothetical protein